MRAADLTKIEAHRARRIGEMLITQGALPEFNREPHEVLVDLEQLDGHEVVKHYRAFEASFATAPFDPEGKLLRFYPGGVTIWSGFPGSGKTTLLRQQVCQILASGSSVFLASLEEDPRRIIYRLAATAAGTPNPTPNHVQWFIDAYAKRFRLWGVIGIAEHLQLLGIVRQLAAEKIRHFVLDSLMCLDVRNDDTEGQRKFANLVATTARAAQIHIHLVAHPRKLLRSDQELDLNDVAGAREIGGIADNVLFVRRDPNRQAYGLSAEVTPMCVSVRKQRHFTGGLGDCEGWFHRGWQQYHREQHMGAPARYLPEDAFR
jgi:twinkle protein